MEGRFSLGLPGGVGNTEGSSSTGRPVDCDRILARSFGRWRASGDCCVMCRGQWRARLPLPSGVRVEVSDFVPTVGRDRDFGRRSRGELEPLDWGASMENFFAAIARDAPGVLSPLDWRGAERVDGRRGRRRRSRGRTPERGWRARDGEVGLLGRTIPVHERPAPDVERCPDPRPWRKAEFRFRRRAGKTRIWNLRSPRSSSTAYGLAAPGPLGSRVAGEVHWSRGTGCGIGARESPRRTTLYLALRPFQVNPPTQFLNTPGGTAVIHRSPSEGAGCG